MPLLTWEPMRTSPVRTLPPPDVRPAQGIVTLDHGRCGPRTVNDYVDSLRPASLAPLKPGGFTSPLAGSGHTVPLPCRTGQRGGSGHGVGGGGGHISSGLTFGVVSSQPSKSPPLKQQERGDGGKTGDAHSSIMCSQCGKCKCAACSEPRKLPKRWCCSNRYEVSAGKAVDVCTCFCCVQTVFYHCGEEDSACYDQPCACGGSKCCSRWTCLAASALFLPCLWCYWPMRCCLGATTVCYNCCRQKGCQCSRRVPDKCTPSSQTRRLLIESESSTSSST